MGTFIFQQFLSPSGISLTMAHSAAGEALAYSDEAASEGAR